MLAVMSWARTQMTAARVASMLPAFRRACKFAEHASFQQWPCHAELKLCAAQQRACLDGKPQQSSGAVAVRVKCE